VPEVRVDGDIISVIAEASPSAADELAAMSRCRYASRSTCQPNWSVPHVQGRRGGRNAGSEVVIDFWWSEVVQALAPCARTHIPPPPRNLALALAIHCLTSLQPYGCPHALCRSCHARNYHTEYKSRLQSLTPQEPSRRSSPATSLRLIVEPPVISVTCKNKEVHGRIAYL
jgi:hypothetical protein